MKSTRARHICDGIVYEVEAILQTNELFTQIEVRKSHALLRVAVEWTPHNPPSLPPSIGDLRDDFYMVFAALFGAHISCDESLGDSTVVYHLITGDPGHSHVLLITAQGPAVAEVIRAYRQSIQELASLRVVAAQSGGC